MKISIGLPNPVPGVSGRLLVDWARRAEERGFAGLATIDRIAYPNHDSLTTLAAAAGATTRIELMTNILLAPVYPAPLLAKVAASVDQLSGGRLTLGLAPGGRPDDYDLTGVPWNRRGRIFDETLSYLRDAWAEGSTLPTPVRDRRVPVLIGGTSDKAVERVLTWGDGWTAGGARPEQVKPFNDRVRTAWTEAGRAGEPRLATLAYFSLGDDAEQESRTYLNHYYAFTGDFAKIIADGALRTPEAIRTAVTAFEDAGCTELYFDPTAARLDQVDRLADLLL
ncbi:MAG: LLM class flavin-dependent oxidoreductase [Hamadaea sp.]|uniref:LLM class flavin-dependent oxidoreductase n=1 Tax=Hamadaea sp. TaxID=2024425 RepID=UPI00183D12C3|nr:LLM class flavin-dependent oxidoreductase [Hamadaea sp.]NUT20430.1 LLM class flavin-dependent oxidoreductase [Hamadaea sp.]